MLNNSIGVYSFTKSIGRPHNQDLHISSIFWQEHCRVCKQYLYLQEYIEKEPVVTSEMENCYLVVRTTEKPHNVQELEKETGMLYYINQNALFACLAQSILCTALFQAVESLLSNLPTNKIAIRFLINIQRPQQNLTTMTYRFV